MDGRIYGPHLTIYGDSLKLQSQERTQFIVLTSWVADSLRRSRVDHGLAQVKVLHTTAAIMIVIQDEHAEDVDLDDDLELASES